MRRTDLRPPANLTAKPTIISAFQRMATKDLCACHYSHIFALLLKSEPEWHDGESVYAFKEAKGHAHLS